MPDGTLLSMPIPSADKDRYDDLCYNGLPYSRILQQLAPKKTFGYCHIDPDIRDDCRAKSIEGWKPGFGQSGSAQGVLANANVELGDLFLFFGWFRKVELYNGCYRYIRTSRGGFYDHSDMHVIYGYMQIGEILTAKDRISEYPWHPHTSDSHICNGTNAIYIPTEHLSFLPERKGYGDFKSVKKDIEQKVAEEVESLYELGFRGADLLTACFGQAVSEFGKYKSVEKSDGSEVSVAELLEMARNAAFDSLLKGVQGDDYTKFYIGWLQLNGTSDTDFDDATKFTRVGVNVNIKDIQQERLLILEGKKMHIAMAKEHIGGSSVEGTRPEDSPIKLYREGDRGKILRFVRDICPDSSSPLWRLLATLKELLPANDDQKQIVGILQNADDLRQHCHEEYKPIQGNLFEGIE